MKSIRRFYKEHRIFIILLSIMIVGFILIFTILLQCFYSSGDSDDPNAKYGARLEKRDEFKIEDVRLSDYEAKLMTEPDVSKANIEITGRIIYIKITFQNEIDLIQAESVAIKSLENFSDGEKSYYDIHFTLTKQRTETSDAFLISGAKNKTSPNIVWNNNRVVEPNQVIEEE